MNKLAYTLIGMALTLTFFVGATTLDSQAFNTTNDPGLDQNQNGNRANRNKRDNNMNHSNMDHSNMNSNTNWNSNTDMNSNTNSNNMNTSPTPSK